MKHTTIILFAGLMLAAFSSCEDWLDVRPQTEVKTSDNFESPQGFKDALTGIYLLMIDETLYGRELSFGITEILGKQFTQPVSTAGGGGDISNYDYSTQAAHGIIDPIWSKMYNLIANINSLIEHIDKADKTMFDGVEYNIIRGEAYALRAFIHFDLLRLYGYSFKAGADKKAIPYETNFNHKTTPLSTVSEVITKALGDLTIAEGELENDPIVGSVSQGKDEVIDYTDYLRTRYFKFNYYAVKLLQARINLYKGDYTEAFKAADKVIQQEAFVWVEPGDVATATPDGRDLVFTQELIFTLSIGTLSEIIDRWERSGYTKLLEEFQTVYETESAGYTYDFRYQYLTRDGGTTRYHIKLYQYELDYYKRTKKLPVMRISEAYYIASECKLNQNDPGGAVGYLNQVRQARGISDDLGAGLDASRIQEEIFKEYAKEFVMEGQLFYYYKRLNSQNIRFHSTALSAENYVLPLPQAELEGRLGEQ